MIVVDASLAAKWLLPEPDRAAAIGFLRDHRGELIAPDLILIEVASAIVRRANTDKALYADAMMALAAWTDAPSATAVRRLPATPVRVRYAGRLALRLGHPVADCLYLALAVEFDCDLATCDARFTDKARQVWPRVRLLADYAAA